MIDENCLSQVFGWGWGVHYRETMQSSGYVHIEANSFTNINISTCVTSVLSLLLLHLIHIKAGIFLGDFSIV